MRARALSVVGIARSTWAITARTGVKRAESPTSIGSVDVVTEHDDRVDDT